MLTLNPEQLRSRTAQASAGGSDRLPSDDGGHYIARRFNGPTDAFNHFAQDANFNRGAYRKLENTWARRISEGKLIHVTVTPYYSGVSSRPTSIGVVTILNGNRERYTYINSSKGKPHGK